MMGDLGAHKFVVKVSYDFAGRASYVRNEVADSGENVVLE